MAVELRSESSGNVLRVGVSGKLEKSDYEDFAPEVKRLVDQHGKIRVLVETHDFHGWDAGALWEDIKFSVRHFNSIDRLAIVGESRWEQGMAIFCKPFTTATVRYFDQSKLAEAESWIAET